MLYMTKAIHPHAVAMQNGCIRHYLGHCLLFLDPSQPVHFKEVPAFVGGGSLSGLRGGRELYVQPVARPYIIIYKFVFCQINHQHICVGPPIQSCMILWIIYIMRVIFKIYICLYIYKCWSILGRPDLPTQFTYIKIYIYTVPIQVYSCFEYI